MSRLRVTYRRMDFEFPAKTEPAFAGRVDRWYQLDGPAFGAALAASTWGESWPRPDFLLFASPRASNGTDREFAGKGPASPHRFVHTLPSVRASSFCQAMGWSGPLLCVQRDPGTLIAGLAEACELVEEEFRALWLLSSVTESPAIQGFLVQREGAAGVAGRTLRVSEPVAGTGRACDEDFSRWLECPTAEDFALPVGRVRTRRVEQV